MNEISIVSTHFVYVLFVLGKELFPGRCYSSVWFPHSIPCLLGSTEILDFSGNRCAIISCLSMEPVNGKSGRLICTFLYMLPLLLFMSKDVA